MSPKLTVRLWLAGTGKPGPVCAVATPNAAATVKVVLANMLLLSVMIDLLAVLDCDTSAI